MDIGAALAQPGTCYLFYDRGGHAIYLGNDAGATGAAYPLGVAGSTSNSQCTIDAGASSATTSGNNLTINLALTFKPAFAGAKNVYAMADNGVSSAWVQLGTWTVPTAGDFTIGVAPTTQIGLVSPVGGPLHTYNYTVSTTASGGFSGTEVFSTNLASGFQPTFNPPSVTGSGTTTLTLAIPAGTAPGTVTQFTITATSPGVVHGVNASVTADSAPSADSVSPSSGSGSAQVFTFVFSDINGATDIDTLQLLFRNTSGASDGYLNACNLWINRGSNSIQLRDDAITSWGSPIIFAQAGTLHNSQCGVDSSGSSMAVSGVTLTVNLAITFQPVFAGMHTITMEAVDLEGLDPGVPTRGSWTVPAPPPPPPPTLVITTSPNLPSGTAGVPYSWTFAAAGGSPPYNWALKTGSAFPPGLSIPISTTGVLQGTPYLANGYAFYIQVNDTVGQFAYQQFGMTVAGASSSVTIKTPPVLPSAATGSYYSQTLVATGGTSPYTWSMTSGTLPTGITLSGGVLSGTAAATAAGTYSFNVLATDNANPSHSAPGTFTLTVGGTGSSGFSISVSPGVATLAPGGSVPYTVTVASSNGFSAQVNLTVAGLPSGASAGFSTNPVTPPANGQVSSTLTISTSSSTPAGAYNVAVSGANGSLSQTGNASVVVSTVLTSIDDLISCVSVGGTCVLAPGTYVVNRTIPIGRYGVTVAGGSTDRTQTRLVRGPSLVDPMIRVLVADGNGSTVTMGGGTQGIIIENLTFCGGGNTHANLRAGPPDYGQPAAMSAPGSPCGDQHTPAPSACDYLTVNCVDIAVNSVDSGFYPADPSASLSQTCQNQPVGPYPYALELNNVDLEDAAGHALSLYATASTGINTPALKVNDVWVHNSAINYSAITGILSGHNRVDYDNKFCDGYAANNPYTFDSDPALFAPRNIRIECNTFQYNNTGAMGGGAMRWVGLRNNYFYANYISPQNHNWGGGGIQIDGCSDRVEISGNTFIGPNSATAVPPPGYAPFDHTPGLELSGRSLNVHDNTVAGQSLEAILAASLFHGIIAHNHVLPDNDWSSQDLSSVYFGNYVGGINVTTTFTGDPCDPLPRDADTVTVTTNDSDPIDVAHNNNPLSVGPNTQPYGVHLSDHGDRSTSRLSSVAVDSDNFPTNTGGLSPLFGQKFNVFLDYFVGLYSYSGVTPGNLQSDGTLPPATGDPRRLPVDVLSASSSASSSPPLSPLWPVPSRCSDLTDQQGNPLKWPPPGTKKGSSRAMFKFSASDVQGASNIFRIQGVFSVGGNDTDGTGGPVGTPTAPDNGLCNFLYDAPTNLVYMGDATGSGWTGSSVVGSNGIDLYSPSGACIIHAATSTSWVSNTGPQPVPKAYVADLILDVTLPATQANKYHIYSFVENGDSNFDGCGFYVIGRCPVWRYSGYWWNVQ